MQMLKDVATAAGKALEDKTFSEPGVIAVLLSKFWSPIEPVQGRRRTPQICCDFATLRCKLTSRGNVAWTWVEGIV
jgi:hypothetical protein